MVDCQISREHARHRMLLNFWSRFISQQPQQKNVVSTVDRFDQ